MKCLYKGGKTTDKKAINQGKYNKVNTNKRRIFMGRKIWKKIGVCY